MGENRMTQEERMHMDEKFESLKDLFSEMINNLKRTIDNFTKSMEKKSNEQQAQITLIHSKTNNNELEIVRLNGKVEKIEAVKEAEDDTKGKGKKDWQFWLVLIISIIFSLSSFIFTLYKILNP